MTQDIKMANRMCHICLKKKYSQFEQSEQSSYCHSVKCLCKYKRMNRSIFIAEVNSRCFYWLSAAIAMSLSRTQIWHFHTELYKFVGNILTGNLSKEYHTDLSLGKVDKLLNSYSKRTDHNLTCIIFQILDCFYWIVLILFFVAWQWKPAVNQ